MLEEEGIADRNIRTHCSRGYVTGSTTYCSVSHNLIGVRAVRWQQGGPVGLLVMYPRKVKGQGRGNYPDSQCFPDFDADLLDLQLIIVEAEGEVEHLTKVWRGPLIR